MNPQEKDEKNIIVDDDVEEYIDDDDQWKLSHVYSNLLILRRKLNYS